MIPTPRLSSRTALARASSDWPRAEMSWLRRPRSTRGEIAGAQVAPRRVQAHSKRLAMPERVHACGARELALKEVRVAAADGKTPRRLAPSEPLLLPIVGTALVRKLVVVVGAPRPRPLPWSRPAKARTWQAGRADPFPRARSAALGIGRSGITLMFCALHIGGDTPGGRLGRTLARSSFQPLFTMRTRGCLCGTSIVDRGRRVELFMERSVSVRDMFPTPWKSHSVRVAECSTIFMR